MSNTHKKWRNSGFLFEILSRQVGEDILTGESNTALRIIKKFFAKSELAKEVRLYQAIMESTKIDKEKADILLNTIVDLSKKLDRSKIAKEKFFLIKEIKSNYDLEDFFRTKVANYKPNAALFSLLELANNPKLKNVDEIVKHKQTLLEFLTYTPIEKDEVADELAQGDSGTNLLIYKLLIEKFNKKYSTLNDNQKNVLKQYLSNINSPGKIKTFINESIVSINKELKQLIPKVDNAITQIKLNELVKLVKPADDKEKIDTDDHMTCLLEYYELVNELRIATK